jgi:uncharacterized protein
MIIFVKVKPSAREEWIERIDNHFVVSVQEPAEKGKANVAVAKILARFLGVSSASVVLKSGSTSSNKVFKIKKIL